MSEHIEIIKDEFSKQAETFNDYQKIFTQKDVTSFALENMKLQGHEKVLEVAAGTCGLGRSIAPFVQHITEFDITQAMLEIGKKEAEEQNISNLSFVIGLAEELPFLENSFDIVISRLAFHHFKNPEIAFEQMAKVLKEDGKIVVLDMEARDENLRTIADHYEKLRDPSHIKCLSKEDFSNLGKNFSFSLDFCKTIPVPVKLTAWFDLTKVQEDRRAEITKAMQADINGGEKTGFEPYLLNNEIYFNHKWMLCIFTKN